MPFKGVIQRIIRILRIFAAQNNKIFTVNNLGYATEY